MPAHAAQGRSYRLSVADSPFHRTPRAVFPYVGPTEVEGVAKILSAAPSISKAKVIPQNVGYFG
jgi:hypothetical protein